MPLVHEAVRAELNARRRGTASTKTRGKVSGGGAKPWRQKGTGRARAGSSRSPVWTGGGVVFGPTPRHYTVKVNRKARRAALRSALSVHAGRASFAVFDASVFDGALDRAGGRPARRVEPGLPDARAAARRRGRRRQVVPQHRARVRDARRGCGVADVIGAASLLVSEAALPALVARARTRRVGSRRRSATRARARADAVAPQAAEPAAQPSRAGRRSPRRAGVRDEED